MALVGLRSLRSRVMEWSVDSPVNVSFTGSGTTDATNVNYTGSFAITPIPNVATQPGDATNADIVVTPVSGIDGYVYLNLLKTDYA